MFKTAFFLLTTMLSLTGCFHIKTPADFPQELRTLHLTSYNVSSSIMTSLKLTLRGANVNLTTSNKAPLTLSLLHSKTNVDMPIAFNGAAASSYHYQISVQMKLITKNKTLILNTPIIASETIVHNVNQVDTPVITPLMRRTLTRRLINIIYDKLTSIDVIKNLRQTEGSS